MLTAAIVPVVVFPAGRPRCQTQAGELLGRGRGDERGRTHLEEGVAGGLTSLVIRRRLLQRRVRAEVMFDPQRRLRLLQVLLDRSARGG